MKLFIDTANTAAVKECWDTGLVSGITTNPSLLLKAGEDPLEVYHSLKALGIPDVSMEVTGTEAEMLSAGLQLSQVFGDTATIKLPMTIEGLSVCKKLNSEGIRTNVTLIFSVAQAVLAANAGATYISPFVGRVEDQGFDGTELIQKIKQVYQTNDVSTQILAASIRTTNQAVESLAAGASIVTMPPAVFWSCYKHILTDKGLEIFERDVELMIGG